MAAVVHPLPENNSLLNLFESCATGFFGPCEDTCQQASRTVFWEPAPAAVQNNERVLSLDFEKLHDQFLESLLHEAASMEREDPMVPEDGSKLPPQSRLLRHRSTNSLSSLDSSLRSLPPIQPLEQQEQSSPKQRKRRRPLRLTRRRTPPRLRKLSNPLSDQNSNASTDYSRASSASVTISLSDLSKADLPSPETFLHELVRMQKDKGKGEPVGSNLCAKERDACLAKLRDKMRLLTQVAAEKATGASMKIRKARVSQREDNFVETRSLINLKMGFLSITYGILLRWDTTKTGTITLVCLRKMCHESFYPRANSVPRTVSAGVSSASSLGSDGVLSSSSSSLEFAPLDPPYCVPRPVRFPDPVLLVTVVSVTGLSKKSNWTVQLNVDNASENMHLQWDSSKRYMSPREYRAFSMNTGDRLRWSTESTIQIKLFESRIRRRIPGRVACTMSLPIRNLRPQPAPARYTRVTVPCSHDNEACVVLDVAWQSDHAVWAPRELEARRKPPAADVSPADVTSEELENQDPWDWICHVC